MIHHHSCLLSGNQRTMPWGCIIMPPASLQMGQKALFWGLFTCLCLQDAMCLCACLGRGILQPDCCRLLVAFTLKLLVLHLFNGLFSGTTWVSRRQRGKASLDLNEARDDVVLGCSGISWTICKQSAPRSRQITTPTPHHSIFTGRMLFRTHPTNSVKALKAIHLH